MSTDPRALTAPISFLLALLLPAAPAGADAQSDRPAAPYLVVTSDVAEPDPLPLKETRAAIHVAGVIAHVKITQIYQNDGDQPLEAIYVFPGSTRSAVFAMRMTVGDRTIRATIDRREAARETYEEARRSGQTASLLEQHRPNVFQMNVANILPGDRIRVDLDYTELLVPEGGVYELVYPAVVGPRYAGESTSGETWHDNPYMEEGAVEPYRFGLEVKVAAGMGIRSLTSPSHRITPEFKSPGEARIALGGRGDGNRDFVLRYRLQGDAIQTGLLRFEDAGEQFFLLMLQPPRRVSPAELPPREYVFLLDVSGSMSGFPLEVAKVLVRHLVSNLRPTDRFNIVFFDGGSYMLGERSVPATPENVARALKVVDERRGGGSTNLLGALRHAFAMPADEGASRTFVAVTDGYISVEAQAFRLVRENLGKANFFAFGVGTSVNHHLIESLARAGLGESFVVLGQESVRKEARRFRRMIESPVLTDVEIGFHGFDAYDVEPPSVPDLLAERPIVIFGKYRGAASGTISVAGRNGAGAFQETVSVAGAAAGPENRALRYLWARHRVATLMDLESLGQVDVKETIARLGLRYSLLTPYTSFVAVDERRRSDAGELVTVKQPLPLPQGVSRHAVGYGSLIAHEPLSMSYEDMHVVNRKIDPAAYLLAAADVRSGALSAALATELTFEHRVSLASVGSETLLSLPVLMRARLLRPIELRAGSSLFVLRDGSAAAPDLTLGTKLSMVRTPRVALGTLVDVRLDFDGGTPDRAQTRTLLLGDVRLADALGLRVNVGFDLLAVGGEPGIATRLGYAGELAYAAGGRLLLLTGSSGTVGSVADLSAELGASYLVGSSVVGLLGRVGLTGAADDYGAALFFRWGL